jgi:large subunit ribosomal protein L33
LRDSSVMGLGGLRQILYTSGLPETHYSQPQRLPSFGAPLSVTMAKSKKKAETVFLVCEETGDHNYVLTRKPGGEKLKLKKYCPRLRKHTLHLEKKK